jgi:signal transduction histidine kinase/CheY-like chemotaxis protein
MPIQSLFPWRKKTEVLSTEENTAALKQRKNVSKFSNVTFLFSVVLFLVNIAQVGTWNTLVTNGLLTFVAAWSVLKLYTVKVSVEVGKFLMLVLFYGFIFFTDLLLGSSVGIFLYYFSFILFLSIIFKWENEKFDTILFVLAIPVVLMVFSFWVRPILAIGLPVQTSTTHTLFIMNGAAAFLIIAIHTISMVAFNSKLQGKNIEMELNLNSLLNTSNANIRTINNQYEISSFNAGFKNTIKKYYNKDLGQGFNMKYELFADNDFPKVLKESYVKALCGERVSVEYKIKDAYYELMAAPLESDGEIKGAVLYDRDITEKKNKEEELKQFSLDLKTLIDNTQGAIWSVNNKLEIITANESFIKICKDLFGVAVYVGYDMAQLFNTATFPAAFKEHNTAVISGEVLNTPYQYLGHYFEISGRPLMNEFNEIIGATFHHINITERRTNEMQVEQLSLNLQSLIDNTNSTVWSIDSNYKLITANKAFLENFKETFGIDVILGFNLKNIFKHPAFPTFWARQYEAVLRGEQLNEQYAHNGKIYLMNAKPMEKAGIIVGAAFFVSDITESFTNSEKIKESEINLQTIINNNTGNVWGIDTNYQILACNKNFKDEMIAEYGLDVLQGFDMNHAFNNKNYPINLFDLHTQVLSGEKVVSIFENNNKYFECKGLPIIDQDKIIGAAFFSEDITLKKQHEKELIAAKEKAVEASIAKARFLSNMSHELRTPLNGVIGITNILCSEEILASQQKHLDILQYSSDHMLSLINDILDFSKIEEGKIVLEKTPFNLVSMIDKTVIMFKAEAKKKGLDFSINTHGVDDLSLIGDVTRLRQVLNNLITNAIKFTEKGAIEFKVIKVHDKSKNTATIEFSISDTGIGIPADKLDQIFESFTQADVNTTRKYGGSGLGLTISKRLVDIMGGSLKVNSILQQGTCFSFELNFEVLKSDAVHQDVDQIRDFSKLRILIAEDNKINMLVAKKQLEKWNVLVEEAENGEIAYSKFMSNNYDLILMDMEMPVMDGLETTQMIRKQNMDIPIIALTAGSFENMHDYLVEKGLNDYVRKPFAPLELNKKISNHIAYA